MPPPDAAAAERRALDLFERFTLDGSAWQRLAADEPPEVMAVLARLHGARDRAARAFPTEEDRAATPHPDPRPETVGAYRLTHLLGEGGMGIVFAGERADGLFDHAVAIKLIHPDRFGEAGLARFARERRLLARLEHPAIARLIDGGVTPEGWPYIIMEKVSGVALDRAAAARGLDRGARVDLLLAVCAAVTAAHQALVVHGDIKPDNILLDAEGQVKLLDFGVARMADDDSAPGLEPRTLAFASPERRGGAAPSVTSDVFALGVLLRCLAGEPPGPAAHIAEPALEAIAAKASAPLPDARYRSVEEMAADLARWRAGRPVRARGRPPGYVVERFVRRNRVAVAVAALVLLALVAALIVSLRGWREARGREADLREIARFQLVELDRRLDGQPGTMALRAQLAGEATAYLDRLAGTQGASVMLRREAADGFHRLALLQGAPDRPSLGDARAARISLAKAARLLANDPGAAAARASILIDAARIAQEEVDIAGAGALLEAARPAALAGTSVLVADWLLTRSEVAQWQGRFAQAAALGAAARARLAPSPASPADALRRIRSFEVEGEALYYGKQLDAAWQRLSDELATASAAAARWPAARELRLALARARWELGTTAIDLGRVDAALPLLAPAFRAAQEDVAADPGDHMTARRLRVMMLAYGQALAAAGQADAGAALVAASVRARQAWWALAPQDRGRARDWLTGVAALGDILADAHRAPEACRLYARASAAADRLWRVAGSSELDRRHNLALLHARIVETCPGQAKVS